MLDRRILGRTGIEVTSLGVGGFLGLLLDPEATPAQCEEAGVEAVRRAVELGVRYFDTSPAYGNGLSEGHLGAGLAALDPQVRAGLTVSTKVGTHPERRYAYGADDVRWCFETSRERLGAIDVVLVHDPAADEHLDTILGPGGAFDALEELKAAGEIRAIGLGVRPHRFLRRAMESGRADVILPSYDYHLIRRSAAPLLAEAAAAGVGVINGSPYQSGLLAGVDLGREASRWRPAAPRRGAGPGDRRLVRGEGSRRGRRGRAVQPAGAPHRRHPRGTADGGGGGVLPGPRRRRAARGDLGGAGGIPRRAAAAPGARGGGALRGQARPSSARTSQTVRCRASWISSSYPSQGCSPTRVRGPTGRPRRAR